MLACVDTATRIAWIYDDHGDSILIRNSFNTFQINLPTLIRKKVEVPDLEIQTRSTRFIVGKAWPWKQNISTGTGKGGQYDLNSLNTPKCHIDIIRG